MVKTSDHGYVLWRTFSASFLLNAATRSVSAILVAREGDAITRNKVVYFCSTRRQCNNA